MGINNEISFQYRSCNSSKFVKLTLELALMIILLISTQLNSYSQSLPVGTPGLEEYYRRAQLMGKLDSTISFCSNPFFPVEALRVSDPFSPSLRPSVSPSLRLSVPPSPSPLVSQSPSPSISPSLRLSVSSSFRLSFSLLPITWTQQFNSHHPYSLNDGPMIPARGYQTLLSGGFFAKFSILSIQFRPELVYAANKHFDSFTDVHKNDGAIDAYNGFHGSIDLPEYFPERPYKKLFPGQSSIRLTYGPVSLGISSENLWWGPGTRNALLMSNSAAGFYHLTFNTVKPIRTPIGSFEFQVIGGKLETSNFMGFDQNGNPLYYPNSADWRYLNAMVLSYQPRWVPGLFLGFTRSFMMMWQDAKANNNYLPVLLPLAKKDQYGEGEQTFPEDQQFSLFARWILPASHAEIYAEFGRGDHNYDLRDMYIRPTNFRAYILGFKKLFYYNTSNGKYVEFNLELTQLEQNKTDPLGGYYFSAYEAPLRGNTNQGQMLGASVGPGSNLQTISLSWGKGLDNIGFQLERYVHNNNLYYSFTNDNRGHWVDINLAFKGQYSWKSFLLSAKLEGIRSYNYEYSFSPPDTNNYWSPGKDIYNVQGNLAVTYRF